MSEKLFYLNQVREDIGEEQFRFAAASIVAKHFTELMKNKGKKLDRMKLLDRVNLTLCDLSCSEISYRFVRSYY
ncbi:hypothetical protein [Bacillus infantis]|uniref:hypothetical protein n=1 Tax=Bacillus infantis TaxID=324767 RepID=UPI00209DE6F2|nr:hypothetical protein [Bacillus infantis]MCP1156998.1 hypothetical protein [Bacillus infantis]